MASGSPRTSTTSTEGDPRKPDRPIVMPASERISAAPPQRAGRPATRLPLIFIGLLSLAGGLVLTAWLIHRNARAPIELAGGLPGIGTLALALITGRFASEMQPAVTNAGLSLTGALAHLVPGPAIVWFPLA